MHWVNNIPFAKSELAYAERAYNYDTPAGAYNCELERVGVQEVADKTRERLIRRR